MWGKYYGEAWDKMDQNSGYIPADIIAKLFRSAVSTRKINLHISSQDHRQDSCLQ